MKINDPNLNGVNSSGLNGSQGLDRTRATEAVQQGSRPGGGRRAEGPSDQVQLSNLSQSLNAADSESPERVARVEQLRNQVASGNYNPDAQQVSQSLVQSTLEGLG